MSVTFIVTTVTCFGTFSFQDMSFFDDPKNHVSALTTNLAIDAALVQGVSDLCTHNLINI